MALRRTLTGYNSDSTLGDPADPGVASSLGPQQTGVWPWDGDTTPPEQAVPPDYQTTPYPVEQMPPSPVGPPDQAVPPDYQTTPYPVELAPPTDPLMGGPKLRTDPHPFIGGPIITDPSDPYMTGPPLLPVDPVPPRFVGGPTITDPIPPEIDPMRPQLDPSFIPRRRLPFPGKPFKPFQKPTRRPGPIVS